MTAQCISAAGKDIPPYTDAELAAREAETGTMPQSAVDRYLRQLAAAKVVESGSRFQSGI